MLVSLINIIFCYIAFFISDRLWDTPKILKIFLFLLSFSGLALFTPYWLVKWLYLKRTPLQLASLLEKTLPSIGDKLKGAIELSTQTNADSNTSDRLKQAAINQISERVSSLDLNDYLPRHRLKSLSVIFVCFTCITVTFKITMPDAFNNALHRLFAPFSDIDRFTFVQLHPFDREMVVPLGESTDVYFYLADSTKYTPHHLRYSFNNGAWSKSPLVDFKPESSGENTNLENSNLSGKAYKVPIPAFQNENKLRIKAGDIDESICLISRPRPALQRASANITMPEYTARPVQTQTVRVGTISALVGATVQINATATENIARLENSSIPNEQLHIEANQITTTPIEVGTAPFDWSFLPVDQYGLKSHRDLSIRIDPVEDQPPLIQLNINSEERYFLSNMNIELLLNASDDFGIKELGVEITLPALNAEKQGSLSEDVAPGNKAASKSIILKEGSPTTSNLESSFIFHADDFKIPPQAIILRAFAQDYFPGRGTTHSQPVTIHILSPEEHAEMIKNQLDHIISSIENILHNMETLSDEMDSLKNLSDQELGTPENKEKLQSLADEEAKFMEQLKKMQSKGEELFKQASRNKEINPQSMKNMMEGFQMLQNATDNKMEKARSEFKKAADKQKDSQKNLNDGSQAHDEAKKELQSVIDIFSEASRNLEAASFAARIKQAMDQESDIIHNLASTLASALGKYKEELKNTQIKNLQEISSLQKNNLKLLAWVIEELNHYRKRAPESVYETLYEDMVKSNIISTLEQTSDKIDTAHIGSSIELASEARELLRKWFFSLVGENNEEGKGEGEGATLSDDDIEFLLKVMYIIQQQRDIRAKTRSIENQKTFSPSTVTK